MTDPQFDYDDDGPLDSGYSQVPHGLWTLDLPMGAKVLLGWLHSHSREFLRQLSANDVRRAMNTSSVPAWLDELEDAGFLSVIYPARGPAQIRLKAAPYRDLCGRDEARRNRRANRAETGAPTAPKPARIEEQGEDQEKNTSCSIPSNDADERFEKFWKLYPRKEAKKAAHSAFKSMLKRKHLDDARKALPEHIALWREQGRDEKLIPLASSWLNGQRYFDEVINHKRVEPDARHRDAGKVFYDGASNRIQIQDDGTSVIIATREEVEAEREAAGEL